MATIIVALVAAVLVIIGLVAFNVRHASADKEEIKEDVSNQPDVPHSEPEAVARPVEPEVEKKKRQSLLERMMLRLATISIDRRFKSLNSQNHLSKKKNQRQK
ncbi:hypothetical protein BsIDN1_16830 [Bacillus safensis]|uniref:Uncharacterized protein n=1 Tax=Bacillus safensis TaxID=561879 RepID=A0A5S9M5I4_BACIA|nr:hypothetical protein BsIDN1_16830 [Bacillus safensis]